MKNNNLSLLSFVAVFATILIFGCSEREPQLENVVSVFEELPVLTKSEVIALSVYEKGTYSISESEARDILGRFSAADDIDNTVSVSNAVLKKNQKTGKDMYYEFVLESDKGIGFSIVSADERIPEMLCYSEVGSISDTSFNKSLKFCLDLMDIYVEEQTKEDLDIETLVLSAKEKQNIIENESLLKNLKPCIPFDPYDIDPRWVYNGSSSSTSTQERLHTIPGNWYQTYPFNDKCPYITGTSTRAYAGCAMIAVGQIMSYHDKPYTYNWATIKSNIYSDDMKDLIRDLFYDMNTGYDINGTSSNITKARSFLNNNGYTAGSASSYSFSGVWNALEFGPTYIRGDNSSGEGHAWVINGARKITTTTNTYYYYDTGVNICNQTVTNVYTSNQVRYDWGWGNGSTQNTWYSDNIFKAINSSHNFNISVQIISTVKPI